MGLLLGAPANAADCVRPKDSATHGAEFRATPVGDSPTLGTLARGQSAPFIASIPRWYETRTPVGEVAFVSKQATHIVDCPPSAAAASGSGGAFELHAIDVGTGLAVFVRGADFTLLYDAGSNDDLARGQDNRVLAYLKTLMPPVTRIDHLLLSHPHRDHVELMPDVLRELDVKNVWDSGAYNNICGYRHFLRAVVAESGVKYRTAIQDAGNALVELPAKTCYGVDEPVETISVPYKARIDDTAQLLGTNASMQVLHADGSHRPSFNENSLVVRLDLGPHKVLLMGDAEAGGRKDPSEAPAAHSIEGKLIDCCKADLQSHVLVAGHHGSKTSSRAAFLDAVGASIFIVSSGPTKYATVTLPDDEVVAQFETRGELFRTDAEDGDCVVSDDKIGPDGDGKAGGCDNILVKLDADGVIRAEYRRDAD
jgi:competence protein ComEC